MPHALLIVSPLRRFGLPRARVCVQVYFSAVDGLKKLYKTKIKPIETLYKYTTPSNALSDAEFDAKPQVMLLGQYSVGKSTFIRYLLEQDYPGSHIGPEPTTDRFMCILHGLQERRTPGNALAVSADKPYKGCAQFGTAFLSKLECSQCPATILESLSFVDTPGVLSGEKQRLGRSYDFPAVIDWFAQKSDLILLLFDAHKVAKQRRWLRRAARVYEAPPPLPCPAAVGGAAARALGVLTLWLCVLTRALWGCAACSAPRRSSTSATNSSA